MDRYADRVPVRIEGSGTRYDGRVWYEHVNSIKTVNGIAVETPLEKSGLKHEDEVTLEYEGKTFAGMIDLESTAVRSSPHPPNEQQGAQNTTQLLDERVSPVNGSQLPYRGWLKSWSYPLHPPPKNPGERLFLKKQVGELNCICVTEEVRCLFISQCVLLGRILASAAAGGNELPQPGLKVGGRRWVIGTPRICATGRARRWVIGTLRTTATTTAGRS